MILAKTGLKHVNAVTHEGKVVVVATDDQGGVFYTVKQDGFEDSAGKTALPGWENWAALQFPSQVVDRSVYEKEKEELTFEERGEQAWIMRSRYSTQDQTAVAPLQLVSALGYIYVFRQSKTGTLLVDRFVLDGINNQVNPKLDVRYKRSQEKYRPQNQSNGTSLTTVDSLDFSNADGQPFYEPTTELSRVNRLQDGWFSVVLVPTGEHDRFRWHIFAYNSQTERVELLSICASDEGLFDVRDELIIEEDEGSNPRTVPGIIRRTLDIEGLRVTGGPAATRYDLQVESKTSRGEDQLLKQATRVMLAVPGETGTAALSFSVATDGTLSQIAADVDGDWAEMVLRSEQRDLLLPADTLDDVQALGDATSASQGTIKGLGLGDGGRVEIRYQADGREDEIQYGQQVKIEGTRDYNRSYIVKRRVDRDTIEVDAALDGNDLGQWEVIPDEEPVRDGQITAFEKTPEGLLRVHCINHGLQVGDEVQITDTQGLDGTYPITAVEADHFTIGARWRSGTGVNVSLQAAQRRGIRFDSDGDYAATPPLDLKPPAADRPFAQTYSAWINLPVRPSGRQLVVGHVDDLLQIALEEGTASAVVHFADGSTETVADRDAAPEDRWVNYAATLAYSRPTGTDVPDGADASAGTTTVRLIKNGRQVAEGRYAKAALPDVPITTALELDGEGEFVELPAPPELQPAGAATIEMWVRPYPHTAAQTLVGRRDGAEGGITLQPDGTLTFAYAVPDPEGQGANPRTFSSVTGLTAGRWSHIAVTRDPERNKLHWTIDGQRVSEATDELAPSVANTQSILLGAGGDSDPFHGQVAELRVWNVARTEQEIAAALHAPLYGDEAGLVGYWRFADGSARDSGPLGVDGVTHGNVPFVPWSLRPSGWRPEFWIGGRPEGEQLRGKIADVQVWDRARTPQEIRDTLYLQMLGREVGLVGYWRMNAIAEGAERKIADFTPYGNDATLYGDAFVSAATLNRTLADGERLAIRYQNEELVGVAQRAVYVESFEYRTDDASPAQFDFDVWGKANRRAEERIPIPVTTSDPQALGGGWFLASCRFTVPDGVTLVRTFGLTEVGGDWDTLEVRRHRMRLVSGSITEARFTDAIALEGLAAEQTELSARVGELAQMEAEETVLEMERRYLESLLDGLADLPDTIAQAEKLRPVVDKLRENRDLAQGWVAEAHANPFNYWCRLTTKEAGNGWALVMNPDYARPIFASPVGDYGDQIFKFTRYDDEFYELTTQHSGENHKLAMDPNLAPHVQVIPGRSGWAARLFKFTPLDDGYYRVTTYSSDDARPGDSWSLVMNPQYDVQVFASPSDAYADQYFKLIKVSDEPTSNIVTYLEGVLKERIDALRTKEQELARLNLIISEGEALKQSWEQQLAEVTAALVRLQTELAALNTALLESVAETGQDPQTMPPVAEDGRGLVTTGALLGFLQPASRLQAVESCEGNVQLSYFDVRGRMRQTLFDATADSRNNKFEEWVPDALQSCLNVRDEKDVINVSGSPIPLNKEWTIEAWFYYPLPEVTEKGWNTLTWGQGGDQQITVKGDGELGTWLASADGEGQFYPCGYNVKALTTGWHHIAAAGTGYGTESTTTFYVDGTKVGEDVRSVALKPAQEELRKLEAHLDPTRATEKEKEDVEAAREEVKAILAAQCRSTSGVSVIGGHFTPSVTGVGGFFQERKKQPFGKLTEVRVWRMPLTAEEIEVNSKTLLSGNEPGLLAYYPLNEAEGTVVRDHAGLHHAEVQSPDWWACPAPIGNPGHPALSLDGEDDYLELEGQVTGGSQTIELWLKPVFVEHRSNQTLMAGDWPLGMGIDLHRGTLSYTHGYIPASEEGAGLAHVAASAAQPIPVDSWSHVALVRDMEAGRIIWYVDGQPAAHTELGPDALGPAPSTLRVGFPNTAGPTPFRGQLAELRFWGRPLTREEIRGRMHHRLEGDEPGLIGYWPLDKVSAPASQEATEAEEDAPVRQVWDHGPRALTGSVRGATTVVDNALPLAPDALISQEYSTVSVDQAGAKFAMMRRFLASPALNGAHLLASQRVEALQLVWIGNAQFEPTLLGYIEGPPPVPSENLTVEEDYNGATAVELVQAEDVEFSWQREQDAGLGAAVDFLLGAKSEIKLLTAPLGVGTASTIAEAEIGFAADISTQYSFLNATQVTTSASAVRSDRLELRGTPEHKAKFSHLGKRFVPKNVGYALVVSGTADVYITRLARTKKMVSYQVLPNPDIPLDVNTITFLMNPAYVMNGSLDGLTGTAATSDRFYRHVPRMRAQYGSRYPSSYFRPLEAYALKAQIEGQDKNREAYYRSFNSRLVDETSLDTEVNDTQFDSGGPISVARSEDKRPGESEEAFQERRRQEEEARMEELQEDAAERGEALSASGEGRQEALTRQFKQIEQNAHASESYANWQHKMELLQIRAGKRNIANTYVWDADGGLRAETQQFANTVEHTIGGSVSMEGSLGMQSEIGISFVYMELNPRATVHLTQTMTKSEGRNKSLELNVELDGVESRGITDHDDYPLLPGEKVDRYRFMTFYLEGSTNNFADFFSYVVDPEWLRSNDEEARALRQAAAGKANKTWRVLHRVTYVERPALMGFGRDVRALNDSDAEEDLAALRATVEGLEQKNVALEGKLDRVLALLEHQQAPQAQERKRARRR